MRLLRGSSSASCLQRLVERDEVGGALAATAPPPRRAGGRARRRRACRRCARRAWSTRMLPHQLRGDAEEVRAVLPVGACVLLDEPQVRLVDERRRLQRVARRARGACSGGRGGAARRRRAASDARAPPRRRCASRGAGASLRVSGSWSSGRRVRAAGRAARGVGRRELIDCGRGRQQFRRTPSD